MTMQINEFTEFHKLCTDIHPDIQADFREAWIEDLQTDRKSTRLNSCHIPLSRMPSSA